MVTPRVHSLAKNFPFQITDKWKQRLEGEPLPEGLVFHCRSSFNMGENYYFSVACLSLFTYRSTYVEMLHIYLCYILYVRREITFFPPEIIVFAPTPTKTRICRHVCDFIVWMVICGARGPKPGGKDIQEEEQSAAAPGFKSNTASYGVSSPVSIRHPLLTRDLHVSCKPALAVSWGKEGVSAACKTIQNVE